MKTKGLYLIFILFILTYLGCKPKHKIWFIRPGSKTSEMIKMADSFKLPHQEFPTTIIYEPDSPADTIGYDESGYKILGQSITGDTVYMMTKWDTWWKNRR